MDDNVAKGISITILFILAITCGWTPVWLYSRGILTATGSRRRKLVLDFISCFAGGVFLSTCLLGLLVEGREEFEEYKQKVHFDNDFPFFEAVAGVGLFLVAAVEKMGFAIMSGSGQHQHEDDANCNFGEMNSTAARTSVGTKPSTDGATGPGFGTPATPDDIALESLPRAGTESGGVGEGDGVTADDRKPRHHLQFSLMRAVLLMLALSFHAVFDGLTVGLQTSASKVWEMLTAIAIHKALVAFCLGLELAAASTGQRTRPLALIVLFAIISPIGIGIGMGVTSAALNELAQLLVSSILQAIATGTFLYVTFFEILGQQFSHSHSGHVSLCLELGKVAAAVLGFACMASVAVLDNF